MVIIVFRRFIDKALANSPDNVDAISEKSRLLLLENNPKQAMKLSIGAVENQSASSPVPMFCKLEKFA
jgi:hypothetical protein